MADRFGGGLIGAARVSGTTAGSLGIASFGVYGGQYAARFEPPFDWWASLLCVGAIGIGLAFAVFTAIRPILRDRQR